MIEDPLWSSLLGSLLNWKSTDGEVRAGRWWRKGSTACFCRRSVCFGSLRLAFDTALARHGWTQTDLEQLGTNLGENKWLNRLPTTTTKVHQNNKNRNGRIPAKHAALELRSLSLLHFLDNVICTSRTVRDDAIWVLVTNPAPPSLSILRSRMLTSRVHGSGSRFYGITFLCSSDGVVVPTAETQLAWDGPFLPVR